MTTAILAAILTLAPATPRNTAQEIAEAIAEHAPARGIDPLLLVALAFRESTFRPTKVNGRSGAIGLFQVMPMHTDYPRQLLTIEVNARFAVSILGDYLRICGGDVNCALSRYNGLKRRRTSFSRSVLWNLGRIEHLRPGRAAA